MFYTEAFVRIPMSEDVISLKNLEVISSKENKGRIFNIRFKSNETILNCLSDI